MNPYHAEVLATAALYALLALGLNVIVGYAGLLHLGYAAFFGIGAYTYALLNLHLGWPFWAGLPAAGLVAGIAAVLLGLLEGLGAGYISAQWKNVFAFAVLILVLLLRPRGLLGERLSERA